MGNMKIKAKLKGDVVDVKVMAKHDMLTYDQAKKKGVDANFITHITAKANGKVVYDVSTSQFWSKNPQFKFSFRGAAAGDKVEITWTDLKGNTVTESKKSNNDLIYLCDPRGRIEHVKLTHALLESMG